MEQSGGYRARFQKPTTLAIEIARHLRDAIIRGEIQPGQRLNESTLMRDLASSRSPVREAFRILEAEGLVTLRPHRGAYVRSLSERDLLEIFEVRVMFETHALRAPDRPLDGHRLATMDEALARARDALAAPDYETWHLESLRFHETLVGLAGNEQLIHLYRELQISLRRYQIFLIHLPERPRKSQHDHEQILAALRQGDRAQALDRLVTHIATLQQELLTALRESDGPGVHRDAAPPARP